LQFTFLAPILITLSSHLRPCFSLRFLSIVFQPHVFINGSLPLHCSLLSASHVSCSITLALELWCWNGSPQGTIFCHYDDEHYDVTALIF
jgi:hypothetical protein